MFEPSFKLAENGIPVLSHNEIEKHAVEFVKSFAPECLKKPQSLDIERFAESYLELTLDFDYLSNDGSVLGRLVFNTTDEMPVYNPEKNLAEYTLVTRGLVMLDQSLSEEQNERLLRSTMAHEAGHWIYHQEYFTYSEYQARFWTSKESWGTSCSREAIEGRYELKTDMDWTEHQAKYFSSCLLMPKPAVELLADSKAFREITRSAYTISDKKKKVIALAADTFQVSKGMAEIRLEQVGALQFLKEDAVRLDLLMITQDFEGISLEAEKPKAPRRRRKPVLSRYEKELIESYNRMVKRSEEMMNQK